MFPQVKTIIVELMISIYSKLLPIDCGKHRLKSLEAERHMELGPAIKSRGVHGSIPQFE